MTLYAKIACDLSRDPRMVAAGPLARLLYIQAVCYSRENLTDGYIDPLILPLVAVDIPRARRLMERLVEVGALQNGDGGWRVPPDVWSRWNPTRDEVDEMRAAKQRAGERGNHERWHVTAGRYDPRCPLCQTDPSHDPSHKPSQNSRTVRGTSETGANRKPSPEPEPEPEISHSPSVLKTAPDPIELLDRQLRRRSEREGIG